jgi:hypothetical protein
MVPAKRPVRGGLKVRAYPVLCRTVEEGVSYGWHRAQAYRRTRQTMACPNSAWSANTSPHSR